MPPCRASCFPSFRTRYVSDALIPPEDLERDRWVAPTPQDIVNSYRGSGVRLRAEDIILHVRLRVRGALPGVCDGGSGGGCEWVGGCWHVSLCDC